MLPFKKIIKRKELATLLYTKTLDVGQIKKRIEVISELGVIDITLILNEIILLRLNTVCYLLNAKKIFTMSRKRVIQLQLEYLEHFETNEDRFVSKIPFVDLVENRLKIYRPLLEKDCIEQAQNIAVIFSINCKIESSKSFIYLARKIYLDDLLNFNKILQSYILI